MLFGSPFFNTTWLLLNEQRFPRGISNHPTGAAFFSLSMRIYSMQNSTIQEAGTQLVTLAEIKTHLRILHDSDDTYLNALINVAQSTIEAETNLTFTNELWDDYFEDEQRYVLNKLPVYQIVGITATHNNVSFVPEYDVIFNNVGPTEIVLKNGPVGKLAVTYRVELQRFKQVAIAKQLMLMLITSLYLERSADVMSQIKENRIYRNMINAIRVEVV